MWQRIQTLWLLLALVAMGVFSFMDLLVLTPRGDVASQQSVTLTAWQLTDVSGMYQHTAWIAGILSVISIVLSILTVLLFRNRKLQRRLTTFNILVLVGLLVYLGIIAWQLTSSSEVELGIKFALSLPLVSIILLYLALRGIIHDDILVRMADRLRWRELVLLTSTIIHKRLSPR